MCMTKQELNAKIEEIRKYKAMIEEATMKIIASGKRLTIYGNKVTEGCQKWQSSK